MKRVILYQQMLGAIVRYHRLNKGMTQRDLTSVQPSSIGHLERGKGAPSITAVNKVAKDLGMKLSDLVADLERVETHLLKGECKPHKDGVATTLSVEAKGVNKDVLHQIGEKLIIEYLRDEVAKCLDKKSR